MEQLPKRICPNCDKSNDEWMRRCVKCFKKLRNPRGAGKRKPVKPKLNDDIVDEDEINNFIAGVWGGG